MSFAIQIEISDIQISPSNAPTSIATRIIFSEMRTIYHGHIWVATYLYEQALWLASKDNKTIEM